MHLPGFFTIHHSIQYILYTYVCVYIPILYMMRCPRAVRYIFCKYNVGFAGHPVFDTSRLISTWIYFVLYIKTHIYWSLTHTHTHIQHNTNIMLSCKAISEALWDEINYAISMHTWPGGNPNNRTCIQKC